MWLLLVPAGIFLWLLAERATEKRLGQGAARPPDFERMPWDRHPIARTIAPLRAQPARPGSAHTAADYLRHLNEACWVSRVMDGVKEAALAADIASLMESPPEVSRALQILCRPIEASFLQKDLNVLGSNPPLEESGRLDRATTQAIKAFQGKFNLPQTGEVDAATVAALRYAVGCIYSQDKVEHGGS
ncbi:MAG TPA: peptidoglycan-binding domain-containing protein [Thermoanaerobaculia bacterium]|jgi:hypothetical protein|nr:peptidoglycan-binding domain-containing protein [Thermoanaerobaculia bacterium]